MSASPFFYIELYNRKLGKWEKFDLYGLNYKDEVVPIDLWYWNGSHELFSVLEFEESYDFPTFYHVHRGLPIDVSDEMQKKFEEFCSNEEDWGGAVYVPDVHWFNLADALLYLHDNETVEDIEAMEKDWLQKGNIEWNEVPKQYMRNPLKSFIDRVNCFLECADDLRYFEISPSDVRIIGWIER